MRKYGFRDWDACLAAIGHGGMKEGQVVNKMMELYERNHKKIVTDQQILENINENSEKKVPTSKDGKSGIVVEGVHDLACRFGKCCNPIPGDTIVGYITRGRGVSIHRMDCVNIINLSPEEKSRVIEAEWMHSNEAPENEKYMAQILVYAFNRNGLLADIAKALTEKNIDIISLQTKTSKKGIATMNICFEISGKEELVRIIDKIEAINSVMKVERTSG